MLLNFTNIILTEKGRLYFELYEQIKDAIIKGNLKKGERLPSIRQASDELGVSRTTVENAYTRLCIEGIIESQPQRGYFIIGATKKKQNVLCPEPQPRNIKYDFSSRFIDTTSADTEIWKKLVRSVLWDNTELTSYGDPQGEVGLRQALAEYSYKARGVVTAAQNIVIGAGVGPLLNILCGLYGRDVKVGFENGGFKEAERIFSDYGIETFVLESDKNGATVKSLNESDSDILFLLPSTLSRLSPTALSNRRKDYCDWVTKGNKLIIEDDYNGELRFYARSVPAFQPKAPKNTVYIGSFSKLLLPSVRIAYMVLPDFLAEKFKKNSRFYNQTCGKIEQLALQKYIETGALEKHLRKLRRIYYAKSQVICEEIKGSLKCVKDIVLYETSLSVEIKTDLNIDPQKLIKKGEENGLRLAGCSDDGSIRLCFAGINIEDIQDGIKNLKEILENL